MSPHTPNSLIIIFISLFSNLAIAEPVKDCMDTLSGETAIAGCSKLIESHRYQGHSLSGLYNNRGLARQNQGDFEGAVDDYKHAIKVDPKNFLPRTNLARALASLEKFDDAIDAANSGLKLAPTAANYVARAEIYERMSEWTKAIDDYDEAVKRQPLATIYYARGIVEANISKYEDSINDFSRAISLNDRNPSFYLSRGTAWSNAGKCEQAIPDFDKAISISPRMSNAYNNRGVCRSRKGDRDGAREDFENALKYDPGNSKAKMNLSSLDTDVPLAKPLPPSEMPKFDIPDTKRIMETPEFEVKDKKQ